MTILQILMITIIPCIVGFLTRRYLDKREKKRHARVQRPCPHPICVKMTLRDSQLCGSLVYLDHESGKVGTFIPYSRGERFIRWMGRMLNVDLAQYHQRTPVGFIAQDGNKDDVVSVVIQGVAAAQTGNLRSE